MLPSDTHPEIEKILIEGYRRMPAWKKLEQVWKANEFARQLVLMDIRRRYPDADEREVRMRMASRWIPRDLMIKAFGWDPEEKGY
jgi:hypothetical protein